jgi:hypothetical protein
MRRMTRWLASLGLVTLVMILSPSTSRADAVDSCPPGFQPSHSGCHFGPSDDDLFLCGGCSCVMIGLGSLSALLLLMRKGRSSGHREGT